MKINEAYEKGLSIVSVDDNKNNVYRLHRLRKKTGCNATGKVVGDKFIIVFWDRLVSENYLIKERGTV